jgi:hypothetical protein
MVCVGLMYCRLGFDSLLVLSIPLEIPLPSVSNEELELVSKIEVYVGTLYCMFQMKQKLNKKPPNL